VQPLEGVNVFPSPARFTNVSAPEPPMPDRSFVPESFGAEFAALLAQPRLAPLGPGTPNRAVRDRLAGLTIEKAFTPHRVADGDMARCCLAGVWLHHDFLDESHGISQDIATPSGSYWHAILHRREPDASNSKYWWRQVGDHPVFAQLAGEAARLGWRAWDPAAFVDECEKERGSGSQRETLLREVQRAEWELLFGWCFQKALAE
jgi:hypothetical protein